MSPIVELLLAVAVTSGTHTLGHIEEGNKQEVKVTLNPKELTESWSTPDRSKRMLIHGAGFRSQDALSRFTDSKKIGKSVSLANGLYKLGYLAKIPQRLGVNTLGDAPLIDKDTDNKVASYSVLLSALSDLYKAKEPEANFGLEFWQSKKGAPGVKFRTTW